MSGGEDRLRKVTLMFATAALASSIATAGIGRWTTNGPNAPSIANLAVSPAGVLYLATGRDFFKSTDGGATWTNLPDPNPGGGASSITIDPHSETTLYALESGIYRSDDGGASWTEPDPGFAGNSLAMDPSNPSVLYLSTRQQIFKSTDGGKNWTALGTTQFGMQELGGIGLVACHPKRSGTVYATVTINEDAGAELWQSNDSGSTWSQLSIAPGQSNYRYIVRSVFGDPSSENTTYAILDHGLFKTTDGGKTWISQISATTGSSSTAAIDPTNPSRLYFSNSGSLANGALNPGTGLLVSADGGTTWKPVEHGLPQAGISSIAIDSSHASLYAGTGAGVFKSTDFGSNWNGPAFVRTGSFVQTLVAAPGASHILFAGTDHELFRSADGGRSWQESGLAGVSVSSVVTDSQTPSRMYAAASSGIMKSVDSGMTWSPASSGLGAYPQQGASVSTVAIDSKTPSTLYTFEFTSFELYKTTDGAATWIPLSLKEDIYALTIDPIDSSVIYAGRYGGDFEYGRDVLIKSADRANSWAQSQVGLPVPGSVSAIAIDPTNDSVLYAGTDKGVFKSTDAASTWQIAGSGVGQVFITALAIDPVHSNIVYAGGHVVYRTTDAGQTWTTLDSGLTSDYVTSLAIDPTGRKLFAATSSGVFSYEFSSGPLDLTVGPDDATRLLSIDEGSTRVSVERLDRDGAISSLGPFGPYSGWTPTATAAGPDFTRILWTHDDGSAALWSVTDAGVAATHRYAPMAGLSAVDVAASTAATHVLWTGGDERAAIQTIDTLGGVTNTLSFGPYAGWRASAIADDTNGSTRLLWKNADGRFGVSIVTSDGVGATSRKPAEPGWSAVDIASGGGFTKILLSLLQDGAVYWKLETFANGVIGSDSQTFAALPGLEPLRLAMDSSGGARILFRGSFGAALGLVSSGGLFEGWLNLATPASGSDLDISGQWVGPFTTNDDADCSSDPSAEGFFLQNGLEVVGSISTRDACGVGGLFQGTLTGGQLSGALMKGLFSSKAAGTASAHQIHLVVKDMRNGNQVIPGGTLDLHR
jgi:hypothetical protein